MKKQIKLILGVLAVTLVGASGFAASSSAQEKKEAILANLRADLAKLIDAKQAQMLFVDCVQKNAKPIKNIINCRAHDNEGIIDKTFSALNVTLSGNEIIIGRNAPDAPEGQGFEAVFYSAEQFNGVLRDLRSWVIAMDQRMDSEIRGIRFKILTLRRISSDEDLRFAVEELITDETRILAALRTDLRNVSTIKQEQENSRGSKFISMTGFSAIGGMAAGPLGILGGLFIGDATYRLTLLPLEQAERILAESIKNQIVIREKNLNSLYTLALDLSTIK